MRQSRNQWTRVLIRTLPVMACMLFASLAAGLSFAAVVTPKQKTPEAPPPPLILKFEGSERGKYYNKDTMIVYGVNVLTGQEMQLGVSPEDPKSYKYNPKAGVMEIVDQLKPGGYVSIEAHSQYNENWINSIKFYKMADGEELPGNFVFYETYENKDIEPHVQVVTLQKFGQAVDVVLPMKQAAIDPGMLAAVTSYKKGDVVTVDVANGNPPLLKSVDLYKPPTEAKMGKVVEAEVAENFKGPAIEVDEGGKTVTLPIRGQVVGKKWVPDAQLVSRVKNLKTGTAVLITIHEADGKTFVREIKAAPAQPAAAAAKGKTGTGKFDK